MPESTEPSAPLAEPSVSAELPASLPAPAAPVPPAPRRGFLSWLLASDDLARARAEASHFGAEQRAYLQRAKVAFELAELALAPGNAVRAGSAVPLAANLLRQSSYWALLALEPQREDLSPTAVWATTDPALLAQLSTDAAERVELDQAMRSTFVDFAVGAPELQRARAELLRRVAGRLVGQAQRAPWQLEWAKVKRATRLTLVTLVVLVPVVLLLTLVSRKTDLAKGKPWHTSSVGAECHPEKSECGGVTTEILFHTKPENNPWFEYDFGAPIAFSSLDVKNRSDFGPERAVPLVVEVSNDDKHFQEVARRTDSFSTWQPSFPTQHARYLRLRVARESILHLEAVQVYP